MKPSVLFVPLAAVAMGVLTWLIGWWGVLAAALVIGVMHRARGGFAWRAALAATIAWAALLSIDLLRGPLAELVSTLGGVMNLPAVVPVIVTLVLPALAAWSAATVGAVVGRLVLRDRS